MEMNRLKRAGLFSAVILIVPAMLLALLSAAVLASHGQIHTTGTLARASRKRIKMLHLPSSKLYDLHGRYNILNFILNTFSSMFLLACLGSTAGMMAFTLQQTICISTCPPDYPYFPQVKVGTASLAWSFYIGWVGSGNTKGNI